METCTSGSEGGDALSRAIGKLASYPTNAFNRATPLGWRGQCCPGVWMECNETEKRIVEGGLSSGNAAGFVPNIWAAY